MTDRWASDNSTLHAEVESLRQRILGMPLVQGQLLEDKNDTKPIPMGSEDAREHAHSSDGDQEGNHKKLLRKVVAGCILTGTTQVSFTLTDIVARNGDAVHVIDGVLRPDFNLS